MPAALAGPADGRVGGDSLAQAIPKRLKIRRSVELERRHLVSFGADKLGKVVRLGHNAVTEARHS